jgi:hypothetical protein
MKRYAFMMAMVMLLAGAAPAGAAEVSMRLSSREAFLGAPIIAELSIDNAASHTPPELPNIPDATVESLGTPRRSSQTTIINGRRSDRTSITYAWQITPMRVGEYVIPSMTVQADGRTWTTRPQPFVVSRSEVNGEMFAEVDAPSGRVYVGQAVPLTLRIWIQPYRDRQYDVKLSERNMWGLLAADRSQWGVFRETLEAMYKNRQRPRGREVLRADDSGMQRGYYLYEIERTVYPDQPGPLQIGPVSLLLAWPTGLATNRGIFSGGGLRLEGTRPIVVTADLPPVEVEPVPMADRPAGYRGAVGRFDLTAEALPTDVAAGEPITLTLFVQGEGQLENLQAPDLTAIAELTRDFIVPDEPLAGVVQDNVKAFSVSIRPRNENVKTIPSIGLSYFDPQLEQFATTSSEPIPITVRPAERLDLDKIIAAAGGDSQAQKNPFAPMAGSLDEPAVTLPRPWMLVGVLAVPPAVFVMLLAGVGLARRAGPRSDGKTGHRVHRSIRSLGRAKTPEAVGAAVQQALRDALGRSAAGVTEQEALRDLSTRGVSEAILDELRGVLADCQAARFAGESGEPADFHSRAKAVLKRLEGELR